MARPCCCREPTHQNDIKPSVEFAHSTMASVHSSRWGRKPGQARPPKQGSGVTQAVKLCELIRKSSVKCSLAAVCQTRSACSPQFGRTSPSRYRYVDATRRHPVVNRPGGAAHALFEGRHAQFDQPRRGHRLFHAAGEVVQAAGKPTFGRPALGRRRFARQHAVAELGHGDALRQVRLAAAQILGQANRDGLFQRPAAHWHQAKPTGGVLLDRRRRSELRFHHHRLGALGAQRNVWAQRVVLLEHAALLDAQGFAPLRVLVAQRLGEDGVDGGLAVQRHGCAGRQEKAGLSRRSAGAGQTTPRSAGSCDGRRLVRLGTMRAS